MNQVELHLQRSKMQANISITCEMMATILHWLYIFIPPTPQVQTEIKKTWTRWNLAFEWEGPVVCGRYRYGSVVVGLNNNSTSSQSHLAGAGPSTRSTTLVSSRAYRSTAAPVISMHATLPGYVISNSDPSIPEEPEDSGPKQVDDISLKENQPVLNLNATAEDEEETL